MEGADGGGSSGGSIGGLPSADAPAVKMRAVGRALCKCVLDDQPLGRSLGRFVFEYLADAHERRVFQDVQHALDALADFDPQLAQSWTRLLTEPQPGLTFEQVGRM